MSELLSLLNGGALQAQNTRTLLQTNEVSRQYGLLLTHEDALTLFQVRSRALKNSGRIEIGDGILDTILLKFCDSPYLNTENYVETISELVELFYEIKNDTQNKIADEELLEKMHAFFDGDAAGSLEKLGNHFAQLSLHLRLYGTQNPLEPQSDHIQNCSCTDHHNESEDYEYQAEEDEQWRSLKL